MEFICITLVLVLIPPIIASSRKHPNSFAISLLSIFLGWTVFGWIVALVWAFSTPAPQPQTIILNVPQAVPNGLPGPSVEQMPIIQSMPPIPSLRPATVDLFALVKSALAVVGVVSTIIFCIYVFISVERQREAKEKADLDYYGTK